MCPARRRRRRSRFPSGRRASFPSRSARQDIWGATPQDREACLATFRALRNEGVFTPPSLRGSLNVPGNIGGLHWGGMAWDPVNRLIIAPVNRLPAIIRLLPRADYDRERKANPRQEITEQDGAPFSMSRQFLLAPSGIPCVAPPWGELVAVHADTGEIAWRSTLGDLRDALGARVDAADRIAEPRRPGDHADGPPLHRRRDGSAPAGVRHQERPAGLGRSAADERPGDAARLHDRERPRHGRDRRRRPRHAVLEAGHDARRLWPAQACQTPAPGFV